MLNHILIGIGIFLLFVVGITAAFIGPDTQDITSITNMIINGSLNVTAGIQNKSDADLKTVNMTQLNISTPGSNTIWAFFGESGARIKDYAGTHFEIRGSKQSGTWFRIPYVDANDWYMGVGCVNSEWRWGNIGTAFVIQCDGDTTLLGDITMDSNALLESTGTLTIQSTGKMAIEALRVLGVPSNLTIRTQGGSCFSGDTKIMTVAGEKRIDSLQVGDMVLSEDDDGKHTESRIVEVYTRMVDEYYLLNGVQVTGEHPFMTTGGWKMVKDITDTDFLITYYGIQHVWQHKKVEKPLMVYNLQVDNTHTYFAADYLVHNKQPHGSSVNILASKNVMIRSGDNTDGYAGNGDIVLWNHDAETGLNISADRDYSYPIVECLDDFCFFGSNDPTLIQWYWMDYDDYADYFGIVVSKIGQGTDLLATHNITFSPMVEGSDKLVIAMDSTGNHPKIATKGGADIYLEPQGLDVRIDDNLYVTDLINVTRIFADQEVLRGGIAKLYMVNNRGMNASANPLSIAWLNHSFTEDDTYSYNSNFEEEIGINKSGWYRISYNTYYHTNTASGRDNPVTYLVECDGTPIGGLIGSGYTRGITLGLANVDGASGLVQVTQDTCIELRHECLTGASLLCDHELVGDYTVMDFEYVSDV